MCYCIRLLHEDEAPSNQKWQGKQHNKLLEYELTQDARVVQNTPFRCRSTYIGLGTESIDEYNTLKEHNEHIVFTNRNEKEKEDMNAVSETMKISQVNGEINPLEGTSNEKWDL